MSPRGRTFRGRSAAAFRPAGSWTGATAGPFTVAAGAKILMMTFATAPGQARVTIRRIRLFINFGSDQVAAPEQPFGAVGVAVASDLAVAAGAASLPGPITEIADDVWMLHQPVGVITSGAFHFGMNYEPAGKAMRYLPEGKQLVFMFESGSGLHGQTITVVGRTYTTLARS